MSAILPTSTHPTAKRLPRGAEKHASAPTLEGIHKHVSRFYGGSPKAIEPTGDQEGVFAILTTTGHPLRQQVIRTTSGYHFITPAYPSATR